MADEPAKQPEGQRCGNCRFHQMMFRQVDPQTGTVVSQDSRIVCKRHAPAPTRNPNGLMFVVTEDSQWCGEWQPANPETIEEGAALMCRLYLLGDRASAYALADKLKAREA